MRPHGKSMGYLANGFSHSCRDEEVEKSIEHYLFHCAALISARHKLLGKSFFECLAELASVKIGNLAVLK